MLEPNTRYTFEYLIYFQAETAITIGMLGPVKPTFSTFRVETPLVATAKPLEIRRGSHEARITGTGGVVQIRGTIRTGVAGGTMLPRYQGKATIGAESRGSIHDQT